MIYLFEYKNKLHFGNMVETSALEQFLQTIWLQRKSNFLFKSYSVFFDGNKIGKVTQGFLNIDRTNHIQSQNYIGLVQFQGKTIHFLPKLFYTKDTFSHKVIAQLSQIHLIWWLSYAQKMHFPFSLAQFDVFVKNNFSLNEVLIFHFAQLCLQKLSQGIYNDFHFTTNNKAYVKGKIITNLYVSKSMSSSKYQSIPCKYETHSHKNLFNIIVKNVCLRLLGITKQQKIKSLLNQLINRFYDLPIQNIRLEDCEKVRINPIFEEWQLLFDYCKMFLSNMQHMQTANRTQKIAAISFLVPTENLFEEFIYGFLKKHFPKQSMTYQDNTTFLARDSQNRPSFRLKQDLVIKKYDGSLLILDAKYKLITIENGVAKGISSADLYQITAYAMRRKCRTVILLYPSFFEGFDKKNNNINSDNLAAYYMTEEFSQTKIKISIVKMPFAISPSIFDNLQTVAEQLANLEAYLKDFFEQLLFEK
ncbi:MAG: McrC family protein [Chitinophagales bacterium]